MRERNIVPVIRVTINLYLEAQKKIYDHHDLRTLFSSVQLLSRVRLFATP